MTVAHIGIDSLLIESRAQLELTDSPLPMFFCFSSCSVSVSLSSANAIGVDMATTDSSAAWSCCHCNRFLVLYFVSII